MQSVNFAHFYCIFLNLFTILFTYSKKWDVRLKCRFFLFTIYSYILLFNYLPSDNK
ncbi:hypothetical protein STAPHY8AQ_20389 [Staphylococcus sp. 8AQ]|nr:hypothetical protein STAPHY8AQ_20389 [Staphylococcus sp. 8AQ]